MEALKDSALLKGIIGLLVVLVSALHFRSNHQAASRDAIAYAAKIRQQQSVERDEPEEAKAGSGSDDQETLLKPVIGNPLSDNSAKDNANTSDIAETTTKEDKDDNSADKEGLEEKSTDNSDKEPKEIPDNDDEDSYLEDMKSFNNNNQWRCACENGFLPPGMLQSLGGAEAVFRMSTGQCYHKQA